MNIGLEKDIATDIVYKWYRDGRRNGLVEKPNICDEDIIAMLMREEVTEETRAEEFIPHIARKYLPLMFQYGRFRDRRGEFEWGNPNRIRIPKKHLWGAVGLFLGISLF